MFIPVQNQGPVDQQIGPYHLPVGLWSEVPTTLEEQVAFVPGIMRSSVPGGVEQRDFIVLSGARFTVTGGGQHPTQISKALADMGHRVLFLQDTSPTQAFQGYPLVTVYPIRGNDRIDHLWNYCFWDYNPGREREMKVFLDNIKSWGHNDKKTLVVCCPMPFAARLAELLRPEGWTVVYWCLDDWAAFSDTGEIDWYSPEYLGRLLDVADGVVATADVLSQQLDGCPVIPNGFNHRVFAGDHEPAPEVAKGEVTVGYWGYLKGNWFDWEAVRRCAEANPTWTFNMVGEVPFDVFPETSRMLITHPNVRFLGAVPNHDLPRYGAAFDVAIMPFKVDALSAAVNPIKGYEYLAAALPAACSYMPELEKFPGVVTYHPGDGDYLGAAIRKAMSKALPKEKVKKFLANATWEKRAQDFLKYVDSIGG